MLLASSDFFKSFEEGFFPWAGDAPVDRNALVSVVKSFAGHAVVEVAPAGVFGEGRFEVVVGLVEVKMVVFVVEDGHGAVAGDPAGELDFFGNLFWIGDPVAVEEQVVGGADNVFPGNCSATVAGTDKQAAAIPGASFDL